MAVHHTSIDMEFHDCKKCKKLCKKCIFKVPKVLRRQNSVAYTPDVVSIGPFHRSTKGSKECKGCDECKERKECKECKLCKKCEEGKEYNEGEFQLMERVKQSYLNDFLLGMKISSMKELKAKVIELEDLKNEGTIGFEQRARGFYAEPLDIPPEEFIEMMIVDGCMHPHSTISEV